MMFKTIIVAVAISVFTVAAAAEENSPAWSGWSAPILAMFDAEQKTAAVSNPSYLGVYIRDVRPDRVSDLKLKDQRGAEITMVDRDGPAGKAGLKEHDVILSFNGKPVEDAGDLRGMIQNTPAGATVSLGVSRDGQSMNVTVELGDRNEVLSRRATILHIPPIDIPGISIVEHSHRYGLVVENLSPQLAEYFGAQSGQGILVRSVEKGTPAESAGFNAGDVILRVGNEAVDDVGDWGRILHHSAGQSVSVAILRNHKQRTISFSVPNHHGSGGSAGLQFSLPSMEAWQDYFDRFGNDIQDRMDQARRSPQMQELWSHENAQQLQQEFARMRPEIAHALHELQEEMRRAFQQHQLWAPRMD